MLSVCTCLRSGNWPSNAGHATYEAEKMGSRNITVGSWVKVRLDKKTRGYTRAKVVGITKTKATIKVGRLMYEVLLTSCFPWNSRNKTMRKR